MTGYYLAMTATTDNFYGGGCLYTTPPTPSPTAHPAFTQTQLNGLILSCESSSYFNYAVKESASCAGVSKVISTITSIYTAYTASVASAQSAAEASASASRASAAVAASSTIPALTPLESCHTQYKAVLDSFDIYGFAWDEGKLDAGGGYLDGNGLLTQLRGCSAITKWKFQNLTVSDTQPYEWHASGQSTIWQKNCIEHAMLSAGAPSDSCSGSG
jgi:hypothetical protein